MTEPGEVDRAGGVEGLLRGADGEPGAQDRVLVAVAGGGVDREAEGMSRAAVAQAAEGDLLVVAEHGGDVAEGAAVGDLDLLELWPVGFGVIPLASYIGPRIRCPWLDISRYQPSGCRLAKWVAP